MTSSQIFFLSGWWYNLQKSSPSSKKKKKPKIINYSILYLHLHVFSQYFCTHIGFHFGHEFSRSLTTHNTFSCQQPISIFKNSIIIQMWELAKYNTYYFYWNSFLFTYVGNTKCTLIYSTRNSRISFLLTKEKKINFFLMLFHWHFCDSTLIFIQH